MDMNMENLEQQVFDLIVERMQLEKVVKEIPEEKLAFDTPLMKSEDPKGLALDSLDVLELITILENDFGIEVPEDDMDKLGSVNAIADYIRQHNK